MTMMNVRIQVSPEEALAAGQATYGLLTLSITEPLAAWLAAAGPEVRSFVADRLLVPGREGEAEPLNFIDPDNGYLDTPMVAVDDVAAFRRVVTEVIDRQQRAWAALNAADRQREESAVQALSALAGHGAQWVAEQILAHVAETYGVAVAALRPVHFERVILRSAWERLVHVQVADMRVARAVIALLPAPVEQDDQVAVHIAHACARAQQREAEAQEAARAEKSRVDALRLAFDGEVLAWAAQDQTPYLEERYRAHLLPQATLEEARRAYLFRALTAVLPKPRRITEAEIPHRDGCDHGRPGWASYGTLSERLIQQSGRGLSVAGYAALVVATEIVAGQQVALKRWEIDIRVEPELRTARCEVCGGQVEREQLRVTVQGAILGPQPWERSYFADRI
jgi:hypothetical protein